MAWRAQSLHDLIEAGTDPEADLGLAVKRSPKRPQLRYQCSVCGNFRKASVLVDIRNVAGITGDFMCDGCRERFRRRKTVVDGGRPVTVDMRRGAKGPVARTKGNKEWSRRFAQALGAPQEALDRLDAKREW